MRVLIVKLSALGDVVQSLPVAMAIKRQVPEARIDWLVERPSAGILAGHPALEQVLISPRQDISDDPEHLLPLVSGFWSRLRGQTYDAVLDLQGLLKSAMYVALSRAGRKIGFSGGKEPWAAWALSQRLPAYDPDRHALERYLDLLEPLGLLRPAQIEYGLNPTPAERAAVAEILGPAGGRRPLVVLHPMAKWASKLWPVTHWGAVARVLADQGAQVVVSGAPADQTVTQVIAAAADAGDRVLDLAGRTGLRELAALLEAADLLVSTDTGVMHLGAAMATPVLALFGPTAPWRTGPYGKGHTVLRLGLDCSPCFKRECPEPRCLTELGPEQVVRAAIDKLNQTRTAGANAAGSE